MVEQHEQGQHRKGQYRRQGHIRPRHGQDAAEHVVVHIRGHAAGAGDDDDADGQGRRTHDGDGRVAVPAGIGGQPQQEERREDHHGDGEVEGSEPQGHGDGQGAEGDVAEAIADHGVPLQYQGDSQQRGAEAYQRPGDQGPLHKGIGQHQGQAHSSTSRNRRPWGEAR